MTDALPAILQEIADIIGEAGALQIAARFGGTRVYIPATLVDPEAHALFDCVGGDNANKLCAHFGVDGRGQRIDIPLHVGGTYRQLNASIAERVHKLDEADASSTEIARKVGITQRTVHRHRARHGAKKSDKQGKLL